MATAKPTDTEDVAKTNDVKLPNYFDVATAAGIVGSKNAQRFFDEVSMITSGDLSDHYQPGISFKSMELAAADPDNDSRKELQRKLDRVKTLFSEAKKED